MGNGEFMKLYQASLDTLSAETVEYIRGVQVVKIFGTKLKSFKALHEAITNYSKYAYDYSLSCKKPYVLYQLIFLGLIAIISIPLSFFLTGISYPKTVAVELIMIFFLAGVMMVSFMKIMWASMNMFKAGYAIEHLENLYNKMQEDKLSYGKREHFDNFNIEFENVSFSYDGKNDVLKNISFKVNKGETIAFVGSTGSGKSSIINLFLRFYEFDRGEILVDRRDIKDYSMKELRNKIGLVLQDPFLYHGTIESNIKMYNKSLTESDIKVAAEFVDADEFIMQLPEKYKSPVTERGSTFSSGQRQLLTFARTIAAQPKILILDEATANIDSETEEIIQNSLKKMRKGRTTIAIAHRLSTIQDANCIYVLDKGEIIESGTHTKLLQQKGTYYKMYQLQAGMLNVEKTSN